jgi:hypothetical protein
MVVLQRWRVTFGIVPAIALAAMVAGCKNTNNLFDSGPTFSADALFAKPDWANSNHLKESQLTNTTPVAPEDLVGADGRCTVVMAQAQATPIAVPVAAPAPDAAGAEVQGPDAATPGMDGQTVPLEMGAVALGMTECTAVRRAGMPARVDISANAQNQRAVVLTYLSGPWPGIYHFADGRLREVERAPLPPEPPKPEPKKKKKAGKSANKPANTPAKPKVAAKPPVQRAPVDRAYVQ